MKTTISALIRELQKVKDKEGDLRVTAHVLKDYGKGQTWVIQDIGSVIVCNDYENPGKKLISIGSFSS